MKRMTTVLRELMARDGVIVYPGVYDPLSAQLCEGLGFDMICLGGNSLGSRLCVAEPLLTLEDLVRQVRLITSAVNIPIKVDAGAGYGEPLHVMRTVRELEAAGVAAIQLEDQIFPKRAHYHKGIEHVIPAEEMVAKIRAAVAARRDPDLMIVGRTDAMLTDGFEEGARRANMYIEAGADMAFTYPHSADEVRRAPKEINGPVAYGVSDGNRKGRPVFSVQELADMGYKLVTHPTTVLMTVAHNVKGMFRTLHASGATGVDFDALPRARDYLKSAA